LEIVWRFRFRTKFAGFARHNSKREEHAHAASKSPDGPGRVPPPFRPYGLWRCLPPPDVSGFPSSTPHGARASHILAKVFSKWGAPVSSNRNVKAKAASTAQAKPRKAKAKPSPAPESGRLPSWAQFGDGSLSSSSSSSSDDDDTPAPKAKARSRAKPKHMPERVQTKAKKSGENVT
jgi:hypothetical protein